MGTPLRRHGSLHRGCHLSQSPLATLFDGPIMEQIGIEIQGAYFDLLDRKFEPERLRVILLLPADAHGIDIELGGLVQTGLVAWIRVVAEPLGRPSPFRPGGADGLPECRH